jgi:type VI secretion system protein ImpM
MGLAEEDTVPTSRSADGPPGWYGKLSTLGDFAQRRLPAHWVQRTDAWLSELMRELPTVLGPRWLETYLTAPVLRFAWAPGVVDMRWWFGVLMPSCDNVGRYFPLLIAQGRAHPPVDRIGLEQLERWYAALVQAAMQTLEDDASMDSFERALAVAPAPAETRLAGCLAMLAGGELLERLAGCTLWWPRAEPERRAPLRWGAGLPLGTEFAAMLRAGG